MPMNIKNCYFIQKTGWQLIHHEVCEKAITAFDLPTTEVMTKILTGSYKGLNPQLQILNQYHTILIFNNFEKLIEF